MTEETVPNEKEITELTAAARSAIVSLEDPAKITDTAIGYEKKGKGAIRKLTLPNDLNCPELLRRLKSEDLRQKLFGLVSALVDAHLDLYESATQKSAGANIVALADGIRLPSLGILQTGYTCLSILEFTELKSNMAELERLVRKGEASSASKDMFVRDAIDVLKSELDRRKMRPSIVPPRQSDLPGKRLKETAR